MIIIIYNIAFNIIEYVFHRKSIIIIIIIKKYIFKMKTILKEIVFINVMNIICKFKLNIRI